MNGQHTPGEWFITPADEWVSNSGKHVQFGRYDISAGSADPEAEHYYRIASVSNVNNDEQNRANARLIAAAPELLAALLGAREFIDTDRVALADAHMDPVTNALDEDGAAAVAEFDAVLARIDAAIAKASGSAS